MSDKALDQQQKEAQLAICQAEIDTLKAKTSMASANAQIETNNQITMLEKKIDEEILHDIPELEVNNTLIRMGGNIKMFRNLICRFSETQADTVVRIKEALAFDNLETARLEVHTLKNLAGTIGATLLEDDAQIVENMCLNNIIEGRDEAIHNLEIDLINLLAKIYTAYGTQRETFHNSEDDPISVDQDKS